MAKLVTTERISLKNHPEIKEDTIQEFIFNNPTVLGLGDLSPIRREKAQPSGGRLDILLADDNDTRYEVEIMLGATDPSHIIRTIEYWDNERKRYPQYDHCAVIVAEEITGRFMNVIQLFNGAIPLIALQMQATKMGDDVNLSFIKVLDRVSYATEDDVVTETTDRHWWEKKSKVLKIVDSIYKDMGEYASGFDLNYNKFYIGLRRDGVSSNFTYFKPRQSYVYTYIKYPEDNEITEKLENTNLEFEYITRNHAYRLKIRSIDEYKSQKDLIEELIKLSMERRNIEI